MFSRYGGTTLVVELEVLRRISKHDHVFEICDRNQRMKKGTKVVVDLHQIMENVGPVGVAL